MSVDEKVTAWVIMAARKKAEDAHLRECPDLSASQPEAENGSYGCDTGCEYARLGADLSCPHGHSEAFTYGDFGDLAEIIEELARM